MMGSLGSHDDAVFTKTAQFRLAYGGKTLKVVRWNAAQAIELLRERPENLSPSRENLNKSRTDEHWGSRGMRVTINATRGTSHIFRR